MRGSNGASEPRAASVESAPVTSAERNASSTSKRPASAKAVENCVPFSSASPSFGPSAIGASPAAASASAAGTTAPSNEGLADADHHRRHVRERRKVAGGAGRALRRHHRDRRPRTSIASSRSSVSSRTPEAPCARLASFSAIISRTIAGGVGSPTPAACESTMFRCSVARSAASIRTVASFPKPVLMP